MSILDKMPDMSREQQEDIALTLRGLVWAYEHRNDDMSHIPGHPGSEAFLEVKMIHALQTMKQLGIPKPL